MQFVHRASRAGLFLLMGGLLGASLFFGARTLLAQVAGDGTAPKVSGITITNTSASTTIVSWETDEEADSLINYGLDKNYGIVRDPLPNKKKHSLTLTDLEPSTMYHLRVVSADPWGNQALSGDYTVTTRGSKEISELDKLPPEEKAAAERAVEAIKDIKTPEGLQVVADTLRSVAKDILEAPVVSGAPKSDEIDSDSALIEWTTSHEANSIVECVKDVEYASGAGSSNFEGANVLRQGNFDERVKEHSVRLVGLEPGTKYHCRAVSEDDFGLKGISLEFTLTTKAIIPNVLTFRVIKVEEDAATLHWQTSVPAAGSVEYKDMATRETKSAGSPDFASSHTVRVAGLRLGTRYQATVKAENAIGEKSASTPIFFTTVKDKAPPLVSKVSNESTLYPSADAKVQTIVSWATDEPSFCQFFYRQGLAPNIEANGLGEEKEPRTAHVQVVVEFLPSTVYQFWVECKDRAKNLTKSENFVLFTPNKEKSIIDIILENFQGTFGWVKNIGK